MDDSSALSVVSVADSLTAVLRERILTQRIPAGARVAEAAIAQDFKVSRPSARVAVERLIAEGLLERPAHHAARVLTLTPETLRDMYLTRSVIETGVYRLLAAHDRSLDGADSEIARLRAAASEGDVVSLVDADVQFHRALVDLLESPGLSAIHDKVINRMRLCLAQVQVNHLLDPQVIEREHRGILDAIRAADPELAEQRGREHLQNAQDRLLTFLDEDA